MMGLASHMEAAARHLLGPPNKALSTKRSLRFGRRGSLAVDLERGVWHDHEAAEGGGVLDLIERCTGLSGGEAVDWLRSIGADIPDEPERQAETKVERQEDRDKAERDRRFIRDTLAGCRPIAGTPAAAYLAWRGCPLPPAEDVLLYHRSIRHPSGATVPAMVAKITDALDADRITGLHLTSLTLTGEGKADVSPRKWTRGTKKSGCIRLVDDADVVHGIGLAEGVETTLAVIGSGWSPVWAAIDAGNLGAFPVLPVTLTAFADRDPAGIAAAEKVVGRWRSAGLEATIAAPPAGDWADAREADHA